jgi:hypothetical protein
VGVDGVASRALAENGDFTWISAECTNVSLYPVECKALVEEAQIPLCELEFTGAWKTEYCKMLTSPRPSGNVRLAVRSIVCCHNNDILIGSKRATIICCLT